MGSPERAFLPSDDEPPLWEPPPERAKGLRMGRILEFHSKGDASARSSESAEKEMVAQQASAREEARRTSDRVLKEERRDLAKRSHDAFHVKIMPLLAEKKKLEKENSGFLHRWFGRGERRVKLREIEERLGQLQPRFEQAKKEMERGEARDSAFVSEKDSRTARIETLKSAIRSLEKTMEASLTQGDRSKAYGSASATFTDLYHLRHELAQLQAQGAIRGAE